MDTNDSKPVQVGYFLFHRLPGGYLGAMLVTDSKGLPLEFKCTEAIKPTDLQRHLYGETMEPHIAIHLCILPLLNKITNKPKLLFVNEESFLTAREEKDFPVLFIQATESVVEEGQTAIVLKSHSKYESDKTLFEEEVKTACLFAFTEPFGRVEQAVKVLGEKDEKFR